MLFYIRYKVSRGKPSLIKWHFRKLKKISYVECWEKSGWGQKSSKCEGLEAGQYVWRTASRSLGIEDNEKGKEEREEVRSHVDTGPWKQDHNQPMGHLCTGQKKVPSGHIWQEKQWIVASSHSSAGVTALLRNLGLTLSEIGSHWRAVGRRVTADIFFQGPLLLLCEDRVSVRRLLQ